MSSLLIVGSNTHAAQLSRDIRDQLIELGLVDGTPVAQLSDSSDISVGDLIQARDNDSRLRVDGGVDEHGRERGALPFTNREIYTVIRYDQQAGELLARDERGGVAHLPKDCVRKHVALAYA